MIDLTFKNLKIVEFNTNLPFLFFLTNALRTLIIITLRLKISLNDTKVVDDH